ncbi:uncharacterized protein L199_004630 [Kwoniella botswanensis]|uniref:uncharacterized protein n=1 Tax=Kwoniella botswanensis TaxID=1268659 RepID=UPI00315DD77B
MSQSTASPSILQEILPLSPATRRRYLKLLSPSDKKRSDRTRQWGSSMKLSFNDTKAIEQLPFVQNTLHQPASFEIDLSGFTDPERGSSLPEDIKRRLQDSNILSNFSNIEFSFRTRSDGSILPQLTRTLPEYYKTPETENGRLISLPVDNKTNEGRDPDNYTWETLSFTSEVEICVDVNSDRNKVLPWYDEESTKETVRSILGDWKSIPAVSICHVKATTS